MNKSTVVSFLMISLASAGSSCAHIDHSVSNVLKPSTGAQELDIWDLIARISNEMPFNKEGFETALSIPLTLVDRNQYMSYWTSGQLHLHEGLLISGASLVLSSSGSFDKNSGATLNLSAGCVRLGVIRGRYPNLVMIGSPKGHSLEESTVYASDQSWGEIIFAFKEVNPDCLAFMTFR